jgi:DNA-binding NtrC family response regulator
MRPAHILILDIEATRREAMIGALRAGGHLPVVAGGPADAAQALAVPGLDLALLSLDTPGLDQGMLREAIAPTQPVEPETLDAVERKHIARTLAYTHGNKRRAAHILGIARSTLLAKVRKYGLDGLVPAESE